MRRRRTRPYSETGIRRQRCSRHGCDNPAWFQWQTRACAEDHPLSSMEFRPVCIPCDVELNRHTVTFWRGEEAAEPIMLAYREQAWAEAHLDGYCAAVEGCPFEHGEAA